MSTDDTALSRAAILAEVDRLRAERERTDPLDADRKGRIWQKLRLDWNYHSNAIEGNSLDYGETFAFLMHGITAKGKPLKDYLDIRGHDQVVHFLLDFVKRDAHLTEAHIREMHKLILVEPYDIDARTPDGTPAKKRVVPGEYKSLPNHVVTRTGATHHFTPPDQVPMRMGDLMSWYRAARDNPDVHPVVVAARFHHEFVSIHPFDDGNGRMARILMNLLLMQRDYLPAIIRTEERNDYYLALAQADTGDLEPLLELIAACEIRSLETWLRGARGEDITEPDDLDKGIALLEQKLANAPEALHVRRTDEVVDKLLNGPIAKFLYEIEAVLGKFDRFFLQPRGRWGLFPDDGAYIPIAFDAEIASVLGAILEPEACSFSYCHLFATYRSENDPFSVVVRIRGVLEEFRYTVGFAICAPSEVLDEPDTVHHARETTLVNLKYHEHFTEHLAGELAARIGQDLLHYLHARHDNPTYGTLAPDQLQERWSTFIHPLGESYVRLIGTLPEPRLDDRCLVVTLDSDDTAKASILQQFSRLFLQNLCDGPGDIPFMAFKIEFFQ